ncbi:MULTISPECIES: hypothetical protein [unclassified Rickettsia]|uniref:hypothetical protein n=1 Tax=unclassified Rickettsia TaxID=114295 RepID=UPI003132FAF0
MIYGSEINKNPSWRAAASGVAIQAIPNIMRDLIRILNKFSIKICLTGWPRHQKVPRHDEWSIHATMPPRHDELIFTQIRGLIYAK